MAEMKKNAQLNHIMRIKQKFGIVLPILFLIVLVATLAVSVAFFIKTSQLNTATEKKTRLDNEMATYGSKKDELLTYANMKNSYNEYFNSVINYDLIFNTITHYIPSNTSRSSFDFLTKGSDVNVTLNSEITGYEDYMSYLRVIDKCSFSSPEQKAQLLNVQRVALGGEQGKEVLGEPVAININFSFSTSKNEFILQKRYDKAIQQMNDLGKFISFINISKGLTTDIYNEQKDYSNELKFFYEKKKEFSDNLSKIKNTDSNGFYLNNTGENFIAKIKREVILTDILIAYYTNYKTLINQNIVRVFDNGDIKYTNADNGKSDLVLNIKDEYDNELKEIEKKLIDLNMIKKYNEYLLDNHYLDTFDKIAKNKDKKYKIEEQGKIREMSGDEYMTYTIQKYGIMTEDNEGLKSSIKSYTTKVTNGNTVFAEKPGDIFDKELKKSYTEYVNKAKTLDKMKIDLLNIDTYLNGFYSEYLEYNDYNIGTKILDYFFNKTKLDVTFLNGIKYGFLNFSVSEDLMTYKKRFLLTIENNKTLSNGINKINTAKGLEKEVMNTEDFIKKTTDIILASHNNIDCTYKDVKMETKDIYNSLLKEKQEEREKTKSIKEIDIIINNFSNTHRAVQNKK